MDETEVRRIVLLGKTGSGKSSLGNTIMREDLFPVGHSSNSETQKCLSKVKNINRKNIQMIDTPGVFDTNPKSPAFSPEILKCMKDCAPGPHAFLLVLKVERYTQQEQDVVHMILKYFSEEALKYTTVVFTRGEELHGMEIKDWVDQNEALRSLVQKCGGRCHVFDNKHWNRSQDSYRNNQVQVRELLRTIEETVEKNRGGFYTNEILQNVNKYNLSNLPLGIMLGCLLGGFITYCVGFGITLGVAIGGAAGYTAGYAAGNPKAFKGFLDDMYKQFEKTRANAQDDTWCRFL